MVPDEAYEMHFALSGAPAEGASPPPGQGQDADGRVWDNNAGAARSCLVGCRRGQATPRNAELRNCAGSTVDQRRRSYTPLRARCVWLSCYCRAGANFYLRVAPALPAPDFRASAQGPAAPQQADAAAPQAGEQQQQQHAPMVSLSVAKARQAMSQDPQPLAHRNSSK